MTPEPPANSRCFIDANILVYYFTGHPLFAPLCLDFMRRVQAGELLAGTSAMMISEALHRIMLSEVEVTFATSKPLAYVQRHPEIIEKLSTYPAAAIGISRLTISLLPVHLTTFEETTTAAAQHHLLTGDASTLAIMRREGIQYVITNDDDFDNIPGIRVCKPR
jgi:predicted nucleic acid-binding protein